MDFEDAKPGLSGAGSHGEMFLCGSGCGRGHRAASFCKEYFWGQLQIDPHPGLWMANNMHDQAGVHHLWHAIKL